MNKVLKGLVAVVSTAAMAVAGFAGAASATAAEGYTLTVNNTKTGHTYEAYQVFKGRLDNGTLSDIEWGEGVDGAALSAAKYNNKAAKDIAKDLKTTANAEAFANNVAGGNGADSYLKTATGSVKGETNQSKEITGLSAGYYLLKDTIDSSTAEKPAAYTKFILKVVGNVDVTPKTDTPSVEKKVQENSSKYATDGGYGAGYNDVADYNIGDAVPFKLIGTVPNMDRYDTYKYTFNDTASNGLTLPSKGVMVYVAADKAGTDKVDITSFAAITVEGQKLTVAFTDLKTVDGVTAGKYIIVEYSATLNGNAVIGLPGNENAVKLTFSNNPNQSGQGGSNPQGETAEDKVIVFTYQLNGTKVDATDNNKTLENAEFKLQRQSDSKWAQIADGKVTAWGDEANASVVKSNANGKFSVAGLDDGKYNVKETKAPAGYDLPADPFEVTLTAQTKNDQEWDGTPASALKDHTNGQFNETFVNNAGSNLPSTGGMGTTILYAAGAAIVLVAAFGIAFAVRRRNAR